MTSFHNIAKATRQEQGKSIKMQGLNNPRRITPKNMKPFKKQPRKREVTKFIEKRAKQLIASEEGKEKQ